MAASLLYGAEKLALSRTVIHKSLAPSRSDFHPKYLPKLSTASTDRTGQMVVRCSLSASRLALQPRFVQHKKEAFWFYRFLSIVYDHIINPGHWTEDMLDEALEPADLNDRNMVVAGRGLLLWGLLSMWMLRMSQSSISRRISWQRLGRRSLWKECEIIEGDAEDLPFKTNHADRYISAESIEYWPDPQHAIKEAYRVLKLRGKACIIGPVYPTFWLYRFFADVWMLFPKEEWYHGVRRHGLIMGCSGVNPTSGDSPLQLGPKAEGVSKPVKPFVFLVRFLLGSMAATYYVLVPIYMWIKDQTIPKGRPI